MFSKAKVLATEYEMLLQDDTYNGTWSMVWEHAKNAGEPELSLIRATCVMLVLEGAADFHQRVTVKTTTLPMSFAWMTFELPGKMCLIRAALAREMVGLLANPQGAPFLNKQLCG